MSLTRNIDSLESGQTNKTGLENENSKSFDFIYENF